MHVSLHTLRLYEDQLIKNNGKNIVNFEMEISVVVKRVIFAFMGRNCNYIVEKHWPIRNVHKGLLVWMVYL